jgi:hypothetical protein
MLTMRARKGLNFKKLYQKVERPQIEERLRIGALYE